MKIIKLSINKGPVPIQLENTSNECIGILYYKSKWGRELYNKILVGIPLVQRYKLT